MRRFAANDFLARPERFSGTPAGLRHQLPGFHTARIMDTAVTYAQLKVDDSRTDDEGIEEWPVIIGVDMSGLKPLPDIDGVRMAQEAAEIAKNVINEFKQSQGRTWGRKRESLVEELQDEYEYGESDSDDTPRHGDSVLRELFKQSASHIEKDPRGALIDRANSKTDPDAWLKGVAKGKITTADILAMSGQFRYEQNVPSSRIVEVWYMQPFWPELFDIYEDGCEKRVAELEAKGWNVVDLDSAYSNSISESTTSVWSSGKKPKRLEYHGTSLNNLISAAPEILMKLPKPPPPFEGRW